MILEIMTNFDEKRSHGFERSNKLQIFDFPPFQKLIELLQNHVIHIWWLLFTGWPADPHISETTIDTAKKFHICTSPIPLAMYMKFHENPTIF